MIPPEGGFREYIAIRYIIFRQQEERKEVCERDNTARIVGMPDWRAESIGVWMLAEQGRVQESAGVVLP